ncbi:MAG TPA: CBS domain-containing protein [Nitrososphaeraceae archaeon]|jgi:CBS domain-containing protein|nr:CBS domain-containing protein [Nitrososphaeraceae archaeon]
MSKESEPVSTIMSTNVKTATEEETIQTVCKSMYENQIGSIVVVKRTVDGINPIGIITERDIVRQIGSSELFIVQAPIRQIMSTPLVTIRPNSLIRDAIETMRLKNISRLPVIDNKGIMVGIVTYKDLLKET